MTLLNFPPTNGQPTDGSFTYTANGVVYTWDGEKWTANTAGSGGMGTVHFTGDTPPPAGEATETDQWFNTNDGRLYTYTKNVNGVLVWADASPDSDTAYWNRNGTTLEPVNAGDSVDLGTGDLSAALVRTDRINVLKDVSDPINANGVRIFDSGGGVALLSMDGASGTSTSTALQTNLAGGNYYFVRYDGTTGIGTDGSGNPNIRLNANGSATYTNLVALTTTTNGIDMMTFQKNGVMQARVTSNGSIFALDNTLQQQTSERRLKENIVAINAETSWNTIKSTPYYTYNFIGDDSVRYGPMADEVPSEMVIETDQSDDEGVIRTYDNGMLQARLYTALQTALTRIEALEAQVQQLEGGN